MPTAIDSMWRTPHSTLRPLRTRPSVPEFQRIYANNFNHDSLLMPLVVARLAIPTNIIVCLSAPATDAAIRLQLAYPLVPCSLKFYLSLRVTCQEIDTHAYPDPFPLPCILCAVYAQPLKGRSVLSSSHYQSHKGYDDWGLIQSNPFSPLPSLILCPQKLIPYSLESQP